MRRIVLCADDYALSPGVSAGIRELIAAGRLNATSVMTIFPEFEQEAKALQATKSPIPFQIGLHATLTGGFAPLKATPITSPGGRLPMSDKTWPPLGYFRIDPDAVKAEVSAQIEKFIAAFGRAPDYIDGHQHVQLMPGIRTKLLEAVKELAPNAWVRQCSPAQNSKNAGDAKTRFLSFLSRGFRAQAERAGLKYNPAFSGAYDYFAPSDFGALFARFIDGLPEGGVVMCHPGHVDDTLKSRDILSSQREKEYAFLSSEEMPKILAHAGVTLA
jgi:predicted glycoside hydrolase/deacetylase ChbG (UPF0249 family)